MEGLPATYGFRHHRGLDNFCQDRKPYSPELQTGLSLHPRWENFLVDGIHLTCLTIEAEKHPLAMDEPQNRSFFHSIAFVIYFWAMEKCAGTSFFIPSDLQKAFRRWKKVAEEAIYTPSDSPKPQRDGTKCQPGHRHKASPIAEEPSASQVLDTRPPR